MRTKTTDGRELETVKMQFIILKEKGMTNKEISKTLRISPQSLSKWVKTLPIFHYKEYRSTLQVRLAMMMRDKTTPLTDLLHLTNAIAKVEKTIRDYMVSIEKRIKTVSN